MKRRTKVVLGLALFALVVLAVWVGFGRSAASKKKLVGTWTLISGGGGGGTTLTFSADGKVKETMKWAKQTYDSEGTYTVKGDTIEMLIADAYDWDEEWGDWDRKAGGGKGSKPAKDTKGAKSNPPSRPKTPKEPKPWSMTIRSLTDTELVVADGDGQKAIFSKK